MAAEICAGRTREVSIVFTPAKEAGVFEVLLNGQEIFNRKKLPTDQPAPDPRAVHAMAEELRGKLIAALDKVPATAGGH